MSLNHKNCVQKLNVSERRESIVLIGPAKGYVAKAALRSSDKVRCAGSHL